MEVFAVGVEEACEGSHESGADLIGAESVWAREVDGGETLVVYCYAAFCSTVSVIFWDFQRGVGFNSRMHLNDSS